MPLPAIFAFPSPARSIVSTSRHVGLTRSQGFTRPQAGTLFGSSSWEQRPALFLSDGCVATAVDVVG